MSVVYQTLKEAEEAAAARLRYVPTVFMSIEYHDASHIETRLPLQVPTFRLFDITEIYDIEREQDPEPWGKSSIEDLVGLYGLITAAQKALNDHFFKGLRSLGCIVPYLYDLEKIYRKNYFQPIEYLEVTNTGVYSAEFFPLRPVKYARRLMISKSGFIGRAGRKKRNGK